MKVYSSATQQPAPHWNSPGSEELLLVKSRLRVTDQVLLANGNICLLDSGVCTTYASCIWLQCGLRHCKHIDKQPERLSRGLPSVNPLPRIHQCYMNSYALSYEQVERNWCVEMDISWWVSINTSGSVFAHLSYESLMLACVWELLKKRLSDIL